MKRRQLLKAIGQAGILMPIAPAICRAESLMPVRNYQKFQIRNLVHGREIKLVAEDQAGVYRDVIVADPDGDVQLFRDGSLVFSVKWNEISFTS